MSDEPMIDRQEGRRSTIAETPQFPFVGNGSGGPLGRTATMSGRAGTPAPLPPSLTLRRSPERFHEMRRARESWQSFSPRLGGVPAAYGFGNLVLLSEDRFEPGGAAPMRRYPEGGVVTYAREGAIGYQDSTGHAGVLRAGEFLYWSAARTARSSLANASLTESAHVFQICVAPSTAGVAPDYDLKRFSIAERTGVFCVVASRDGRHGSLRIQQDALIHAAVLDSGRHLIHELVTGRSAWIHLVTGEAVVGNLVLTAGDAVGVTGEPAVSVTARLDSSLLLVDVGPSRSA